MNEKVVVVVVVGRVGDCEGSNLAGLLEGLPASLGGPEVVKDPRPGFPPFMIPFLENLCTASKLSALPTPVRLDEPGVITGVLGEPTPVRFIGAPEAEKEIETITDALGPGISCLFCDERATCNDYQSERPYGDPDFAVADRFILHGEQYILAQPAVGEVVFISLENGNRFVEPVCVDDPRNLTWGEFLMALDIGEEEPLERARALLEEALRFHRKVGARRS